MIHVDVAQPNQQRNRAERLSRLFWIIAAVPLGLGLAGFADFALRLFPDFSGFLTETLRLPLWLWPALMFALGLGLAVMGLRRMTPLRITTVRIMVQTLVMTLFCVFVFATTFSHLSELPQLQFWLSKFLEVDPLVSIATSITTHTLYKGLIWSLLILIPTLFLGRIFCNWICPYGILHQFTGWLFGKRDDKAKIEANRYRWYYSIKYFILFGMIAAALFGNLAIGLLDPICLLHRSVTTAVLPTLNMPTQSVFGDYKMHMGAWIIGFILLFLVGMNLVIPRFFCRVLCPLGATLGILSRFALYRIERDPAKCTDCDLCLRSCEGASDPHTQLRMSECFVCFNCIEDCPEDALSFARVPRKEHEVRNPDVPRRHLIFSAFVGALFFSFTKVTGKSTKDYSTKVIRPPGSVEEQEFLKRCIKCDQCLRVCPTNVLQPATFESGLEGLWTPIMNFRMGFCQLNCTACGQVCPTGAIQRITVDEKLGVAGFADAGPVRLGTAHFDMGRCLPWSKNVPCVVCEEVCPTSPKAIHSERKRLMVRDGKKQIIRATPTSVTVGEYPKAGEPFGAAVDFTPQQYRGDQTTAYFVEIITRDGGSTFHRLVGNTADTLEVEGELVNMPEHGDVAVIYNEFKVPKIDTEYCIGCGICEHECPVSGDRRAVYVTADGETRSQDYLDGKRNRSLRLQKATGPSPESDLGLSLTALIMDTPTSGGCGTGGCGSGCSSGCGSKKGTNSAAASCGAGPNNLMNLMPTARPVSVWRRFLG